MANYEQHKDYFEQLCVENKLVLHNTNGKKFYGMEMEEFYSGSHSQLPAGDKGPFMIFLNYLTTLESESQLKEGKQLMFYILQSFPPGNYTKEMDARNKTELVVRQFLGRIRKDSQEGHAVFNHGMDKISKVRIIPHKKESTSSYIGYQVVIYFQFPSAICYDANDWNI